MNKERYLSPYSWLAIACISALSLCIAYHVRISWDISWLLEASRRFVAGGNYTHNFFENNPPLIIYIYSLAVLLSTFFGSLVFSFLFLSYLIALLSLSISYSLLKKICSTNYALLNTLLLTLCFAELLMPSTDFGQREDLSLMLIMPYLLLSSLRLSEQHFSKGFLILCGLMAGIGFSIKPHFIIPLALILIWVAYKKRTWEICFFTENLSIFAFMCSYLLAAATFNGDYFQNILPLVYHYYLNYWSSALWLLLSDPVTLCVLLSLFVSLIPIKQNNPYQGITQILWAANAGFLIVFFIQSQDWYYHLLPCVILSLLLLMLNIFQQTQCISQELSKGRTSLLASCLNLLGSLLSLAFIVSFSIIINLTNISRQLDDSNFINQILNQIKSMPHGPFMMISTSLEPNGSLLSYSGLRSSSRAPSLWLLPGALKLQQKAGAKNQALATAALQLTRDMVIEDLQQNPPYVIVIDNTVEKKYLASGPFDYLTFLEKDPRFRALWKDYCFKNQTNGFLIYTRCH